MEIVIEIINQGLATEKVLSVLLIIAFIGAGIFIKRDLWPFITENIEKRRVDNKELEIKRLELTEKTNDQWVRAISESNKQWVGVTSKIDDTLLQIKTELTTIRNLSWVLLKENEGITSFTSDSEFNK